MCFPFNAPGSSRPGALRSAAGLRQKIDGAVSQGTADTTLMELRVANAKLLMQNGLLEDESRAWRRTKILNSWLGTGIQGVGTGLQLSHSLSMQLAGDVVGVVGGAATIVFAVCTTELDPPDFLPAAKPVSDLLSSSPLPSLTPLAIA